MLRRTIALLFLTMIGCGFFWWSKTKSATVNEFNNLLDSLSAQVDNRDFANAQATINKISELYENKKEIFNMVNNHEFMNTLSDYINEAETAIKNTDISRIGKSISYMRNHINDFYNDSKIKLSNII